MWTWWAIVIYIGLTVGLLTIIIMFTSAGTWISQIFKPEVAGDPLGYCYFNHADCGNTMDTLPRMEGLMTIEECSALENGVAWRSVVWPLQKQSKTQVH